MKRCTSFNLFVKFPLMYCIMSPCTIHSDTVANRYCPKPLKTPTSFRMFGWDSEFQRITSLQNCWQEISVSFYPTAKPVSNLPF